MKSALGLSALAAWLGACGCTNDARELAKQERLRGDYAVTDPKFREEQVKRVPPAPDGAGAESPGSAPPDDAKRTVDGGTDVPR